MGFVVFWCIEECIGVVFFDDFVLIYEDYLIGYFVGKVYFMGDIDYCYVFGC